MKVNSQIIKSYFNKNDLNKIAKKNNFKKVIVKKHYNKEDIYNFINKKAIIIQSFVRRYLAKLYYNFLINSVKHTKEKYIYETSIIGQTIEEIPSIYFINISLNNEKNFFFDIREIYKIININSINPFTNLQFTDLDMKKINKHIKVLRSKNVSLIFNNEIPIESILTCKITELVTLLSDDGFYIDMEIINNFDTFDYINVIDQIIENPITGCFINQTIINNLNNYYYNFNLFESRLKIITYVLNILLAIIKFQEINHSLTITKKLIIFNAIQFNGEYYNDNRNSIINLFLNYNEDEEEYEEEEDDDNNYNESEGSNEYLE